MFIWLQGDSLTHLMLITEFLQFWPEGYREPRNEVGYLSRAEFLVGIDPGTFRFWFNRLNVLGHSPLVLNCANDTKWY